MEVPIIAANGGTTGQIGLASMDERARLAGGGCAIDGRPGRGTRVELRIPLLDQRARTRT